MYRTWDSQEFRVVGIRLLYPFPGYCGTGIKNLHKFRGRVWMSYITHRSSGYGYGCTELTDVSGTGTPLKGAKNKKINWWNKSVACRILRLVYCLHWYTTSIHFIHTSVHTVVASFCCCCRCFLLLSSTVFTVRTVPTSWKRLPRSQAYHPN